MFEYLFQPLRLITLQAPKKTPETRFRGQQPVYVSIRELQFSNENQLAFEAARSFAHWAEAVQVPPLYLCEQ